MVHTCNNCNIDFKYESILKRHLNRKTQCGNNNLLNTRIQEDNNINVIIPENNLNDSNNKSSTIFNIINNKLSKTEVINILISLIGNNKNLINNIDNIDNININNDNDINNENTIDKNKTKSTNIINKYNCKKCNKPFANRHSLHTHNKLNRCKEKIEIIQEEENIIFESRTKSGLTLNDILGINVNDSDNNEINNITNNDNSITNNNITNNNNNNNNNNNSITNNITINAFGCESLEHITTIQFKSIFNNFNNLHKILYNLSNLVYKNNNMNFTKNNMNKNIVTYLSRDMEVKNISERDFIKEFEDNIKKLCIELFHIHKNDISLDDLIEYMKSFLLYFDILQEKKINHIELKEQLKSIMDYVFRDENINEVIRKIKVDLENNKELKIQCLKESISRQQKQGQRLNEYYVSPHKDNKDERHLCKIKDIALEKNIKDRKNMLDNNLNKKYNKKLENLENKDNEDEKSNKVNKNIIVQFDEEIGIIIDDRE